MNYYYDEGFSYIEVGDSDELWENRKFSEIRRAYSHIFRLMREFYIQNRLYIIFGNHDIVKKNKHFKEKNLYYYYDEGKKKYEKLFENIEIHEGLILRYKDKDIDKKIFIAHGHQGDLINDHFWWVARFLVRYVWKPLEMNFGFKNPTSPAKNFRKKRCIKKNISEWVKENNQMTIIGHTHRPMFPEIGGTLYFNTGSCIHPSSITGIEIQNGEIALVKWSYEKENSELLDVQREIIAGPVKLQAYF